MGWSGREKAGLERRSVKWSGEWAAGRRWARQTRRVAPRVPHVGRLQPLSREPQCHGNEYGHGMNGWWGVTQTARGTCLVRSRRYGPTAGDAALNSPPGSALHRPGDWAPTPWSPILRAASVLGHTQIYKTQLARCLFSQLSRAKLELCMKYSRAT